MALPGEKRKSTSIGGWILAILIVGGGAYLALRGPDLLWPDRQEQLELGATSRPRAERYFKELTTPLAAPTPVPEWVSIPPAPVNGGRSMEYVFTTSAKAGTILPERTVEIDPQTPPGEFLVRVEKTSPLVNGIEIDVILDAIPGPGTWQMQNVFALDTHMAVGESLPALQEGNARLRLKGPISLLHGPQVAIVADYRQRSNEAVKIPLPAKPDAFPPDALLLGVIDGDKIEASRTHTDGGNLLYAFSVTSAISKSKSSLLVFGIAAGGNGIVSLEAISATGQSIPVSKLDLEGIVGSQGFAVYRVPLPASEIALLKLQTIGPLTRVVARVPLPEVAGGKAHISDLFALPIPEVKAEGPEDLMTAAAKFTHLTPVRAESTEAVEPQDFPMTLENVTPMELLERYRETVPNTVFAINESDNTLVETRVEQVSLIDRIKGLLPSKP